MKTKTKVWLITAAALVLIGGILFTCIVSSVGWDLKRLSSTEYETNTHEIEGSFRDISVASDTADLVFLLSDNNKCRVTCYEEKNAKHAVSVKSETLVIEKDRQNAWSDYIGLHFDSPKITVYLPKTEYNALSIEESTGNIEIPKDFTFQSADISLSTGNADFCAAVSKTADIKASTGNIHLENTAVGALKLSATTGKVTVSSVQCQGDLTVGVSTGRVDLTDLTCKNFISNGTTGNISFDHVIAANGLSVERSTGDVTFERSDAAELYIKTSTGNVKGSLLSQKVFLTETSTGDVDVPKTTDGGNCKIKTATGDIKIRIEK